MCRIPKMKMECILKIPLDKLSSFYCHDELILVSSSKTKGRFQKNYFMNPSWMKL